MRKWARATQEMNGRGAGRDAVIELRIGAPAGFKRKAPTRESIEY